MTTDNFESPKSCHRIWHSQHSVSIVLAVFSVILVSLSAPGQESEGVTTVLRAEDSGHSAITFHAFSATEILMIVFTGIIAVVGIVTAFAALRQARAVERSNRALIASQEVAARLTSAAEKSNEASLRAQKIGVTPNLEIEQYGTKKKKGLILFNSGVGPAEILEFTIYVDGKPVDPPSGFAGWAQALRILGLAEAETVETETAQAYALSRGSWVTPEKDLPLFTINEELDHGKALAIFKNVKKRLGFRIVYQSLYGEKKLLEVNRGKSPD